MLKTFALRERETPLVRPPARCSTSARPASRHRQAAVRLVVEQSGVDTRSHWATVHIDAFDRTEHPASATAPRGRSPRHVRRRCRARTRRARGARVGQLQRGESVDVEDGTTVTPAQVLGGTRLGRRVVVTGDTRPWAAPARSPRAPTCSCTRRRSARTRSIARTTRRTRQRARQRSRSRRRRTHPGDHAPLQALQRARARRRGAGGLPDAVCPRDFDLIEVPFAERGAPTLVKAGAHPGTPRRRTRIGRRMGGSWRWWRPRAMTAPPADEQLQACAARYDDSAPSTPPTGGSCSSGLVELGELRGVRVLEIGCGTGRLAQALEERAHAGVAGPSTRRPRWWLARRASA